jgi:hypothetical protein
MCVLKFFQIYYCSMQFNIILKLYWSTKESIFYIILLYDAINLYVYTQNVYALVHGDIVDQKSSAEVSIV